MRRLQGRRGSGDLIFLGSKMGSCGTEGVFNIVAPQTQPFEGKAVQIDNTNDDEKMPANCENSLPLSCSPWPGTA
jgi:hypothetical protein